MYILAFLAGAFFTALVYHVMIDVQVHRIQQNNLRHAVVVENVIGHVNKLERLLKSHDIKLDFTSIRGPLEIVENYLTTN